MNDEPPPSRLRILETCLYAADLPAAEAFYGDLLGLPLVDSQPERFAFFRAGDQMLLIFNPAATRDENGPLPTHGATGAGHLALAVDARDLEKWQRRLEQGGVAIERRVRWGDRGDSIYFRDPAGNSIELAPPSIWSY